MIDIDKLSPGELFDLKDALAAVLVFGPWTKDGENVFFRPEPARRLHDSRVSVWRCDGEGDLEAGWYWRVGFGVVGVLGCTGTTAYERVEDCMADVDKYLATEPSIRFVGS